MRSATLPSAAASRRPTRWAARSPPTGSCSTTAAARSSRWPPPRDSRGSAPEERTPENARRASTRGTGDLVRAALDAGVERITIGLGGSATTDGGSGLLRQLGLSLLDDDGAELPDGGAALASIGRARGAPISMDQRLPATRLVVASDVTNPLCGPRGAAATYGPQKGADPAAVEELDAALAAWGRFIERTTGRLVADLPGAGRGGWHDRRTARVHERTSSGPASRSSPSWSGWPRHSRTPTS